MWFGIDEHSNSLVLILLTTFVFAGLGPGCDEPAPPSEPAQEPVEEAEPEPATDEELDDADGSQNELTVDVHEIPEVPDSLDELPEGLNVVQFEMQVLTVAMQNILRFIANDDLGAIPGQIQQVHPAYQLTHEAIEGELYVPPANPDQIEEFVAADDAFHDDLRGLLQAAGDDDLEAATDSYADLVQGCTSCHGDFRFP